MTQPSRSLKKWINGAYRPFGSIAEQQLHVAGRVTWKVLKTAIVAAGIAALLFTGAFAASETVRVNTINLIVEVFGTNTVFQFESQANGVTPAIRVGWVPDGFTL